MGRENCWLLRAWLSFLGATGFQCDPLLRVYWDAVYVYYPVEMWAVGAACGTYVADHFAFFYVSAWFDQ